MVWTFLRQQQQRGAQFPNGGPNAAKPRQADEAPREAVAGREAQDHDYADLAVSDGEPRRDIDYPATNPPERSGDITPSAPDAEDKRVEWDEVVQPERTRDEADMTDEGDDLPLPEGK